MKSGYKVLSMKRKESTSCLGIKFISLPKQQCYTRDNFTFLWKHTNITFSVYRHTHDTVGVGKDSLFIQVCCK